MSSRVKGGDWPERRSAGGTNSSCDSCGVTAAAARSSWPRREVIALHQAGEVDHPGLVAHLDQASSSCQTNASLRGPSG